MSRRTFGSWTVGKYSDADKEIPIHGPGAWVDYDDVDRAEARANAKLIAAAPTMYELLARMLRGDESAYDEAGQLLLSLGYEEE